MTAMSNSQSYPWFETDVLVIGAGGAGCCAAMAAADRGVSVTLLDKGRQGLAGATYDPFTRGKGLTVADARFNPNDDPEVHVRLAIEAARGLADPGLVRLVAYETPARFRELLAAGFPFRTNRLGACFGGGMIGAVIEQRELAAAFRKEITRRNIRLLEGTMVIRLIVQEGRCTGAIAVTAAGELLAISAGATVLATGGASPIFRYNFASPGLTGDGHRMALAAGATLTNLEFYQAILGTTHPVRTFFPQWFLIGKPTLTDARGRRFLPDYVPSGADADELVARRGLHGPFTTSCPTAAVDIGIYHEIMAGRGTAKGLSGVLCDFAGLSASTRQELDEGVGRPALHWLAARGIDFERGPVPIAPFAHAFNGGVVIDEHGQTATPGLYACGEVSAGPYGANRVGGHMFAVLLVFGKRAGEHAAGSAAGCRQRPVPAEEVAQAAAWVASLRRSPGTRPVIARRAIQAALSPIMIEKDDASLARAEADLDGVELEMMPHLGAAIASDLFAALGVVNLHRIARLVVQSARLRKESRGPHYRTDYPHETSTGDTNLIWSAASGNPSPVVQPVWRLGFLGRKG